MKYLIILFLLTICIPIKAQNKWISFEKGNEIIGQTNINVILPDSNGFLYAGGGMTDSGLYPIVTYWNGTQWAKLGYLSHLCPYGEIYSMCLDKKGNLYVSGSIVDYVKYRYIIAKWDGHSWTKFLEVNSGNVYSGLLVSCDIDDNIYASGSVTDTGLYFVLKYNGNVWSKLGNASTAFGQIKSDKKGNLYTTNIAPGQTSKYCTYKWDGAAWIELKSSTTHLKPSDEVDIYIDTANNLYAVGAAVGYTDHEIYKWDGAQWSQLGLNANGLNAADPIDILYADGKNVYVSGQFQDSLKHHYISYWDGNNWKEFANSGMLGQPGSSFSSMCADKRGDLFVAGFIEDGNGNSTVAEYTSGATGISSVIKDNSLKIYPNPCSSFLNVSGITTNSTGERYSIYNSLGEIIYSDNIKNENFVINTNFLQQGLYFLRINSIGSGSYRFIKE